MRQKEESRRAHKLDNHVISMAKTKSGYIVVNECVQMCVHERTGLKEKMGCSL